MTESLSTSGPARLPDSPGPARPGKVRRLSSLLTSETFGGQAIRFAAVGAFNTLFSFGVFAALEQLLGHRIHYEVTLVIATVVGILEAYLLQRWLVYQVQGQWWRDLARFSSVYAVVLCVNLVVLPLLVEVWHLPVTPAQGAIMVLIAVGTFLTGRYFTFRRVTPAEPESSDAGIRLPTEGTES